MKSFGTAVFILCAGVLLVKGYPGPGDKEHPANKCGGSNMTISDDFKKTVETCYSKTPDQTKPETKSCPMVCSGKALGVFDAAGKPVKDKVAAALKTIFPAALINDVTTAANACIDQHEKSIVMKEGDCSSYNDLMECGNKAVMKICWKEG